MLIMALLLLSIGFLQNRMDLLEDVLNPLNESSGFVGLKLNMGRLCMCGTQGLESQSHIKWAMVNGAMESHVVVVLNIRNTLIPCTWMLRVIHVQDVHNHPIDDLSLAIGLG
jgi:hypothetical protein